MSRIFTPAKENINFFFLVDMNRKKSAFLFSNLLQSSKKRVRKEKEELDELLESIVEPAEDNGKDENILSTVAY